VRPGLTVEEDIFAGLIDSSEFLYDLRPL